MSINKFINKPDGSIFHSNSYAEAANRGSIGATSSQSFRERRQINHSRQAVGNYGSSMIGRGHMREVARPHLAGPERPAMAVPPRFTFATGQPPVIKPNPIPTRFTNPGGRSHNPFS